MRARSTLGRPRISNGRTDQMITVSFIKYEVNGDDRWRLRQAAKYLLRAAGANVVAEIVNEFKAKDYYVDVAKLDCDDLEFAWLIMQNGTMSDSWVFEPRRAEITPLVKPFEQDGKKVGWRSADIGDLFIFDDGRCFVCADYGFIELPTSMTVET